MNLYLVCKNWFLNGVDSNLPQTTKIQELNHMGIAPLPGGEMPLVCSFQFTGQGVENLVRAVRKAKLLRDLLILVWVQEN